MAQPAPPPIYIAAYDIEADPAISISAAKAVADMHRRHNVPATFFIVTRLLEAAGDQFRTILDDELFDIQSHTHTHPDLKALAASGQDTKLRKEIELPLKLISQVFGREVLGMTTPGGYTDGLLGQPQLLQLIHDSGMRFVRSDARGPNETIPAPFTQPYWYASEGFPDILELPPQYWHDNVLKGYTSVPIAWPPLHPWGVPPAPPESPEEEFAIWRLGADYVAETGLRVYMPTMHPWSIWRLNHEARTLDLLLDYVRGLGMEIMSCRQVYERAQAGHENFPQQKAEPPTVQGYRWPRHSLLSEANHDLRTPLHPIVGFAELLGDGTYGPLNDRQQECADEILRCAERLAYMFEEIVAAEKLEARRIPIELEVLSVEALFRQLGPLASELPGSQPRIETTIEPGAEAVVADEERLLEILMALLRNCVAFHPQEASVSVHARRLSDRVLIELSDDGPGLRAEIAPKVFLPLFRGQDPRPSVAGGLGLGLTIAAGLARLMHGELRLEQRGGRRNTFVVDLPAGQVPESE